MFTNFIVNVVDFSRRFAAPIVLLAVIAGCGMATYVATHIKINTDINQLLSPDLQWRQNETAMEKAFPQKVDQLVVVIDGDSRDSAEDAAEALANKMRAMPELFHNVTRPDAIPFFHKNGLLYLPEDELNGTLDTLVQAQPLLGTMAADPSLRGLFGTMVMVLDGLKRGDVEYARLDQPFTRLSDTIESVLAGQDKPLPWRSLMSSGTAPEKRDLRKLIITQPVLDYAELSPGEKASDTVRKLAQDLKLTPDHGVRVRLTGAVALNDEEFASVANGTLRATIVSVALVLVVLFLALRSFRLIAPILLTLFAGLISTTAFAMCAIGSLNLISVAFAVMFVGIAVDFGIQFGVRYREQMFLIKSPSPQALKETARIIAVPLALAAASTSIGFFAFMPTDYRGVAELGEIAGVGMLIAFALNVTLLPALLALFRPKPESEAIGYAWAAPADDFIEKYRGKALLAIAALAIVAAVAAARISFDFDPLNLKDPQTESVSTLFDLMGDPEATPYTIELLEPSLAEAQKIAERIAALPEVSHVETLASFVPEAQDKKLAMISDANFLLAPTLNPASTMPQPSEDETYSTLEKTAASLHDIGENHPSAQRLANVLDEVVERHDPVVLKHLYDALISGLQSQLASVRNSLTAEQVTPDSITDDLRRDWITPDGQARIAVYPKGDARNHDVLTAFTSAVRTIAPDAGGAPISIQESGKTVVGAFVKAGAFGLLAISLLVWLALRSVGDVLRLFAPLVLAGILTLATMTIVGLPLNFANIIALPLLLSLGVSYAIYFVSYWRAGMTKPLQSSMARAVLFSAATTLVAFGSLSLSSHPGTSGMGELLTIAMIYSLACTFFVLPALLGGRQSC